MHACEFDFLFYGIQMGIYPEDRKIWQQNKILQTWTISTIIALVFPLIPTTKQIV